SPASLCIGYEERGRHRSDPSLAAPLPSFECLSRTRRLEWLSSGMAESPPWLTEPVVSKPPARCTKWKHLSCTVTNSSAPCGKATGMQWAPPKARAVPRIFDRLIRLRPAQAWVLILLCTDLAALADLLTGPDL